MLLATRARIKVLPGAGFGLGTGPGARVWGWGLDLGTGIQGGVGARLMLRLDTELVMVSGLAGVGTKAWIWNWCRFGDADDGTDAQAGLDWCLGLTQVLKDAEFEIVFWEVLSPINTMAGTGPGRVWPRSSPRRR